MSPMKRARKRDQIGWLTCGPACDRTAVRDSSCRACSIVRLPLARRSYDGAECAESARRHVVATVRATRCRFTVEMMVLMCGGMLLGGDAALLRRVRGRDRDA